MQTPFSNEIIFYDFNANFWFIKIAFRTAKMTEENIAY